MAQQPSEPTPTPPPPSRPNLRRARRQAPMKTTKVIATRNTMGLGPNIAVSVLDLSETGIRMILKENLPLGREFEITVESQSSRPFKVVAAIIWSVPTAEGTFCVGARFSKNLPMSALATLVRP